LIIFIASLVAILALTALYISFHTNSASNELILFGNVDVRQVDLGFRVFGKVNSMPFQEGDLIQPGTLVATLDPQPYEDEVLQAKANLQSALASYKYAKLVLQRREKLVKEGGISQEDYETAVSNRDIYKANVEQAKAALGVALTNLDDTKVYAPNLGTILTRIREPGSVVRVADPVYTLSLTSPIWIRAFVGEPFLGIVYPGMEAEIITGTIGSKVYKGHIGFISPVAEFTPKTVETTELRSDLVYRLRIIADNPDQGLRQGMPVTVRLKKKS
jgi:HlyD family secretion protein